MEPSSVKGFTVAITPEGEKMKTSWRDGWATRTETLGGFVADMFSEDQVAWRAHCFSDQNIDEDVVEMRCLAQDMASSQTPPAARRDLARKYRELECKMFIRAQAWWAERQARKTEPDEDIAQAV